MTAAAATLAPSTSTVFANHSGMADHHFSSSSSTSTEVAANHTTSNMSPSSSSLFSSDEARFISDSFASAQNFDPFQPGAPGIKVPALLPPGLIQTMSDAAAAAAAAATAAPRTNALGRAPEQAASLAGPSSQPWTPQQQQDQQMQTQSYPASATTAFGGPGGANSSSGGGDGDGEGDGDDSSNMVHPADPWSHSGDGQWIASSPGSSDSTPHHPHHHQGQVRQDNARSRTNSWAPGWTSQRGGQHHHHHQQQHYHQQQHHHDQYQHQHQQQQPYVSQPQLYSANRGPVGNGLSTPGGTPSASSSTFWPSQHHATPMRPHHSSQSFTGSSSSPLQWPSTSDATSVPAASASSGPTSLSGPTSGPYGQNRAWQQQQLEALQAERKRYMEQMSNGGSGQGLHHRQESGDSSQHSSIENGSYLGAGTATDITSINAPAAPVSSAYWPSIQQLPSTAADYLPGMARYSNGTMQPQHRLQGTSTTGPPPPLSTLAMSFPSSHDFPDASPPAGRGGGASDIASHHGNSSFGSRMDQSAGVLEEVRLKGPLHSSRGVSSQPQPSPSGNARASNAAQSKRKDSEVLSTNDGNLTHRRESRDASDGPMWQKRPCPSEPSQSYPPLAIRPDLVDRSRFTAQLTQAGSSSSSSSTSSLRRSDIETLCAAFYGREATEERRRVQPHLVDLKERRRAERSRKLQAECTNGTKVKKRHSDANLTASEAGAEGDTRMSSGTSNAGKKAPHTLLTEAEKKANHIASEQKRRANIRKGYEMLCAGVPSLRDDLDDDTASGGVDGGARGGDIDGEDDGDKGDGKSGPRSEAVVLGHSVEHIRRLLEIHRDLRSRRDHARLKLARAKLNVNILSSNANHLTDGKKADSGATAAAAASANAPKAGGSVGSKKAGVAIAHGAGSAAGSKKKQKSSHSTVGANGIDAPSADIGSNSLLDDRKSHGADTGEKVVTALPNGDVEFNIKVDVDGDTKADLQGSRAAVEADMARSTASSPAAQLLPRGEATTGPTGGAGRAAQMMGDDAPQVGGGTAAPSATIGQGRQGETGETDGYDGFASGSESAQRTQDQRGGGAEEHDGEEKATRLEADHSDSSPLDQGNSNGVNGEGNAAATGTSSRRSTRRAAAAAAAAAATTTDGSPTTARRDSNAEEVGEEAMELG